MSHLLLWLLSLPFFLIMLWPLVAAARRVLGVRLGAMRTLAGALVGWTAAGWLVRMMPASALRSPDIYLGLLIPIAGGAFLATLVFLFVAEVAVPSGSLPGPPALLRQTRRRVGRIRRYSQISRIAVRHGLGPYFSGRSETDLSPHRRARLARSLCLALEDAGVTFVKLGQLLSTRPDLLPPAFVEELSRLQDQVAHVPAEQIEQVLRDELGAPPEELFAEFEWQPLAAASIAQVYCARLRGGTDVVVKVQRPGIGRLVERDLDIIGRLARSLHQRARWARSLGVVDLADGLTAALAEELDFRVEARNIAAVTAASAGGDVALPVVRPELSTARVLVMERLDGTTLGTLPADLERDRRDTLAQSLLECVLRQVMLHGVFHADPHPGNVLLLTDGRLGLLDFGSVGRLDASLRSGLQDLLLAVDRGDPATLFDALLEIVDRPDDIDEQRLQRALGALVAKHFSHGGVPNVEMFTDLFRVVAEFRLAVPAPIAAVFRALATMEGTLAALSPGFDMVGRTRAFASAQLAQRLHPESLRKTATEELLALLPVIRRLPRRLDRIGGALEQGRLSVNIRLLADERDRAVLNGMLHEALLAFLGAVTGLMAVLLLAGAGGPRVLPELTLHQLFGYNLLTVSALVGLRLLFLVFRAQRARATGKSQSGSV
jgi:ubiquinone biosynthesis protein